MSDILSYADIVEEMFINLYQIHNIADAPDKKKPNKVDSLWRDIYHAIFEPSPEDTTYNNCHSKLLAYDIKSVESVTECYIKLCNRYDGVIKFNQWCNLTGYNRFTIDLWEKANCNNNGYVFSIDDNTMEQEYNNLYIIYNGDASTIRYNTNSRYESDRNNPLSRLRFDVKKKLRSEMQDANTNGMSNDTMGAVALANNDDDYGKLWEPRRMVRKEQIRHVLSSSELPKLSDNSRQFMIDMEDTEDHED